MSMTKQETLQDIVEIIDQKLHIITPEQLGKLRAMVIDYLLYIGE